MMLHYHSVNFIIVITRLRIFVSFYATPFNQISECDFIISLFILSYLSSFRRAFIIYYPVKDMCKCVCVYVYVYECVCECVCSCVCVRKYACIFLIRFEAL